jgi:hypothetical protein
LALLSSAVAVFLLTTEVSGDAQQPQAVDSLPTVIAAEMPVYDGLAKMAKVTGSVRVKVQTDGQKVQLVSMDKPSSLLSPHCGRESQDVALRSASANELRGDLPVQS